MGLNATIFKAMMAGTVWVYRRTQREIPVVILEPRG